MRHCTRARLREPPIPDNSAPRAVAPRSVKLLSAGGRGRGVVLLLQSHTCVRHQISLDHTHPTQAQQPGFRNPASPHHSAVHAACWGHFAPQHPCHRPS